jgi:hypothetical protein
VQYCHRGKQGKRKQYSEALSGRTEVRHKLTVKPKGNSTTEEIQKKIKSNIDLVNLKIGIRTSKASRTETS